MTTNFVIILGLIVSKTIENELPCVPADRPLEKTTATVATRYSIMFSRSFVSANLAETLASTVVFHFDPESIQFRYR